MKHKLQIKPEEAKKGFQITSHLTNELNEDYKEFFKTVLPKRTQHHREVYLRSKLDSYFCPISRKWSGAGIMCFSSIPFDDKNAILEHIKKHFDKSSESNNYNIVQIKKLVTISQWIYKWLRCHLGKNLLAKILDLNIESNDFKIEFNKFKELGIDNYLANIDIDKMKKIIDWINDQLVRLKGEDFEDGKELKNFYLFININS